MGAELWPHVVYVLNRGGRFQGYHQAYKDGQLANKYGKMVSIYMEKFATTKHSMTGKTYLPHADYIEGRATVPGNLERRPLGYDMTLITYKSIAQTKSRTSGNYWLQAICPENLIEISETDANRLGTERRRQGEGGFRNQ